MNQLKRTYIPKLLGYLGLIPFFASSILIWVPQYHQYGVESLKAYSAIILTFIGGVHWGLAMQSVQDANSPEANYYHNQFIFSVIPSLIAWIAIVFLKPFSLIILALCFCVFWFSEKLLYIHLFSTWYRKLRNHLTLVATLIIAIGWLGTL